MIPQVYFYFDSNNLYNQLIKNQKEFFECADKGSEFVCFVNVSNIEDLKYFIKYLKEEINLNMGEIGELTSEIWDGYGFDELEPHFGEETSEKIIDESWAYLCDLFPN